MSIEKNCLCKVNGHSITMEAVKDAFDIELDIYYQESPINKITDDEKREILIETFYSLIYEQLLLENAKKLGIVPDEKELEDEKNRFAEKFSEESPLDIVLEDYNIQLEHFTKKLAEELTIKKMLAKIVENVQFTEKELLEYYNNHQEYLEPKKQYFLRVITLNKKNYAAYSKAILEKLKKGISFAHLAKVYSEDELKNNNGEMGYCALNVLDPDLRDVIAQMKPGSISDFILSKDGNYSIYYCEKINEPQHRGFNEIKNELGKTLMDKLHEDQIDLYVQKLFEEADIQFNEKNCNAMFS